MNLMTVWWARDLALELLLKLNISSRVHWAALRDKDIGILEEERGSRILYTRGRYVGPSCGRRTALTRHSRLMV